MLRPTHALCLAAKLLASSYGGLAFGQTAAPATSQHARDHTHTAAREIIESELNAYHQKAGFPGATIGYVLADGTTGGVSVGWARSEDESPMTPEHRMMAGSVGKVLFATLALMLVEDEKLELDKKISHYLGDEPWFDRLPNAADITIQHLMNHTSGIPRYVMLPGFIEQMQADPDRMWKPVETLEVIFDKPATFPAGQGFSYADTNFIVLAMIMEKVSGRTCYEQIADRVLEPLGLDDAIPTDTRVLPRLACGYVNVQRNLLGLTEANVFVDGRFVFNPQFEWAGGGYATTPVALARYARALYGGDVLGDEARALMFDTKPAPGLGREHRYGLGVIERPGPTGAVVGHSGYFPGYLTEMNYHPETGVALALQVNTTQMDQHLNPGTMKALLDRCATAIAELEPVR